MRVVLDTNIIVSRYISSQGNPATIMAAWRAGRFDLVVSPPILDEYRRTLSDERLQQHHGLSAAEIDDTVGGVRLFSILVTPTQSPAVIADDPDDDKFLACAVSGHAQYIVSGDRHLLELRQHRGIRVLSPSAFVRLLEETQPD